MAPTNTDAPKLLKRRKLGKGKKKAWRASNVKELHDFLDDERRQVESGGLVSEISDDKLFTIDTKKVQKPVSVKRLVNRKEHFRNRPLRAHALLQPSTHIESAVKPFPANFKKGKKTLKILDQLQDRIAARESVISVKREKDNARRQSQRLKEQNCEATNDIWKDGENTVKEKVYRPSKLLNKPSKIEATLIPHPGSSVNPSYEDHQALLQQAVETEEIKRKKAIKIANCLRPRVPRSEAATPATDFAEMAIGLVDDSESEDDTEANKEDKEEEDSEEKTYVQIHKTKSKQQKRHEAKLKIQMRNKKAETERRIQESMVEQVRSLKREIRQQEEKEQAKQEEKLKEKEKEPYRTKRLGKVKYEEPDVDLKLSEELVAHMREVKPEGHILKDVYSSMLKRNIMEPRLKQPKKRKSVKLYIKKSHRDV